MPEPPLDLPMDARERSLALSRTVTASGGRGRAAARAGRRR
jgi:hypothetical protein